MASGIPVSRGGAQHTSSEWVCGLDKLQLDTVLLGPTCQGKLHYGHRRVHVQLQREGSRDNHKRVYRLYRDQGLSLRLKRNKAAKNRQPLLQANHTNHIWGMDFVSDPLLDGRRLCLLTIIGLFTRECLGIVVGQSLVGRDVQEALTAIARFRGNPDVLKTDNGPEFAGKLMGR